MARVARSPGGPRRDARVPLALGARARPCVRRRRRRDRGARSPRLARRGRPRVRAQQLRGRGGALRRRARALAGGPGAPRPSVSTCRRAPPAYDATRQQDALEDARDALLAAGTRSAPPRRNRTSRASSGTGASTTSSGPSRARGGSRRRLGVGGGGAGPRLLGPHPRDRRRARRRATSRGGGFRDGDRARARRASRARAHDDRHGEERGRPRDRAPRTWSAPSRSRLRRTRRSPGDRQQPRRQRDVRATSDAPTSSTPRRCASASGTETPRAFVSSAATTSGSTSCSGAGTWPRVGGAFIAECEAGSRTCSSPSCARSVRHCWLARGEPDAALRDQFRRSSTRRRGTSRFTGSAARVTAALYAELGRLDEAHARRAGAAALRQIGIHGA